jgi:large subunit ribosomal protein L13
MLPKSPLGRQMFKKLKVVRGAQHPHAAQQPKPKTVTTKRSEVA